MSRFKQVRFMHDPETMSIFGRVYQYRRNGVAVAWEPVAMSCEREWQDNQPNISCVPTGFYHMVDHNGDRYKDTLALIGATVSQGPEDLERYACVMHKASRGSQLQGCVAWGDDVLGIQSDNQAYLSGLRTGLDLIRSMRDSEGLHYLTIENAPGFCPKQA